MAAASDDVFRRISGVNNRGGGLFRAVSLCGLSTRSVLTNAARCVVLFSGWRIARRLSFPLYDGITPQAISHVIQLPMANSSMAGTFERKKLMSLTLRFLSQGDR